jgi:L-fuculose-phosphate aldolase
MPQERHDLAREIVDVARRLHERGLVAATDGNISARLAGGTFLTTRTGLGKGNATVEDLLEVNAQGEPVGSSLRPSTEIGMHLFIYAERPDVHAVVHAHPPYATAFAVAGRSIPDRVLPEVIVGLGAIPLAPYATPSTPEVAASLAPFVKESSAILLRNHGVVTYAPTLTDAYFKMDKVEHAAKILLLARLLGGETSLTPEELQRLIEVSPASYGKTVRLSASADPAPNPESDPQPALPEGEILAAIRQMIQKGTP